MRAAALSVLAAAALAATACGYADPYAGSSSVANESPGLAPSPTPSPGADDFNAGAGLAVVTYPDGLQIIDLTVGTGQVARTGENATLQYTGWFTSGAVFDTSRQTGRTPITVTLGQGQVIAGWDEGIPGMKVGGKRKLIIPFALAYGVAGQTDPNTGAVIIPPSANLIFEVELTNVAPGPTQESRGITLDLNA